MNSLRIILTLALAGFAGAEAAEFDKSTFTGSSGDELRYALLKPAEAPKPGGKLPLVVTLHGVGGRGKDNWENNCAANGVLAGAEMRKTFPCFVMAPTCAKSEVWWGTKGLKGKERLPDVFELIESLLKKFPVDPERVYVTGQSMGGFGSFGAVGQRPDLFAAAVPVCGGFEPARGKDFAHRPIWIFHGDKDSTISVERSREMVAALEKAGGEPKYTEYPGVGHNSWTRAYGEEDLWTWLFAQRRTSEKTK